MPVKISPTTFGSFAQVPMWIKAIFFNFKFVFWYSFNFLSFFYAFHYTYNLGMHYCIEMINNIPNQNLPFLKSSKQIKPAKSLTPRPTRSTSTTRGTTPRPPPPIAELQAVQEHRVNLLRQECQRYLFYSMALKSINIH